MATGCHWLSRHKNVSAFKRPTSPDDAHWPSWAEWPGQVCRWVLTVKVYWCVFDKYVGKYLFLKYFAKMSVSHWLLNKMILRELLIQLPQNRSAMPRPRPLPEKTCSPSNSQERSWLPDFPPGPSSNHQSKVKSNYPSSSKSPHNLGRHMITNVPGGEAVSSLGSQPRSGRNDDRLGRGNPKQDQQVNLRMMKWIKLTNRHQDIF